MWEGDLAFGDKLYFKSILLALGVDLQTISLSVLITYLFLKGV
jgi:hypothetical protein